MLDDEQVLDVARDAYRRWRKEQDRLDRIDAYMRGDHAGPYKPKRARTEYRKLAERATTNVLPLVVGVFAQSLFVEGYRPSGSADNGVGWDIWQANGMDGRQTAIHEAALAHGHAYTLVLPGEPTASIRGVSARRMIALYEDVAEDDWALFALRVDKRHRPDGSGYQRLRLYDDQHVYELTADEGTGGDRMRYTGAQQHAVGVCPVVRYCDGLDLDGRARGEVEPLIPMQDRLNQTVFDLLMTQTFSSFKVRTIAGMVGPETTEEAERVKRQIAQDQVLTADDPDTRFGVLEETPLDGFISAVELCVKQIATVAQVQPHHLLGSLANLSADALTVAESGQHRKTRAIQHEFGEAHERTIRLAAHIAGHDEADDISSQVRWSDPESRSLAQYADALGKLAAPEGLGIPRQVLWGKVPFLTDQDLAEARRIIEQGDPLAQIAAQLERQMGGLGV